MQSDNDASTACAITRIIDSDLPLREARAKVLEEFERRYVIAALARNRGNVTRAAARSGIARRYFHALLARYGVVKRFLDFGGRSEAVAASAHPGEVQTSSAVGDGRPVLVPVAPLGSAASASPSEPPPASETRATEARTEARPSPVLLPVAAASPAYLSPLGV